MQNKSNKNIFNGYTKYILLCCGHFESMRKHLKAIGLYSV